MYFPNQSEGDFTFMVAARQLAEAQAKLFWSGWSGRKFRPRFVEGFPVGVNVLRKDTQRWTVVHRPCRPFVSSAAAASSWVCRTSATARHTILFIIAWRYDCIHAYCMCSCKHACMHPSIRTYIVCTRMIVYCAMPCCPTLDYTALYYIPPQLCNTMRDKGMRHDAV